MTETSFRDQLSYIPLRSSARTNEEEAYLTLSRWDRALGFVFCCLGAAACFLIAFLTLPFLALKPRKFAVAFSLGSLLFLLGFAILQGPVAQAKHMASPERLPFTAVFVVSLALTLYFALAQHAFLGTLICAIVQVVALVSYLLAYFPGGIATLRFGGRIALSQASSLLPT